MGKVVGLLTFLFLCAQVFGQPGKIDSLKVALSDNDSTRVGALMDVAHLYADSAVYHDFVVNCLREAMDSALVQKNDSIQIDIYNYFGLADFTIGDYENATNNFYKALNLLDKTPDIRQQAKIYNNLGMKILKKPWSFIKNHMNWTASREMKRVLFILSSIWQSVTRT
jgi:tetratricopeptide (TPR) repeat protein